MTTRPTFQSEATTSSAVRLRVVVSLAITIAAGVGLLASGAGVPLRAAFIAAVCLFFWLTEWLPVWIPTVLLWAVTPLLLAPIDDQFMLSRVLEWSLDPVIALFLAGFAFAAAARQHGIDRKLARLVVNHSRGSSTRLIAAAALATAFLSMWVSNVAAAALMFGAFRPIWNAEPAGSRLRRALLLSIALAANVGGIATPVGTGPNGIAMAAVAHQNTITFLHWMAFGVPLALGLVAISVALVLFQLSPGHIRADIARSTTAPAQAMPGPYWRLGVVFGVTVVLWLAEPLHQIPAWIVALSAVFALVALRVLHLSSLLKIDWGTLLLVAGGIALGALLDRSGLVRDVAASLPFSETPSMARLVVLCLVTAAMSALMSNTGTVALLIPLAATFDPAPSTAIIIAVASSLGMPFVVSTPANAMAVASGLRSTDLLRPGFILMIGGCVLVAVTGQWVLRATGIP